MEQNLLPPIEQSGQSPFQIKDIPNEIKNKTVFKRHHIMLTGNAEVTLFEGDEIDRYAIPAWKVDPAVTGYLYDPYSPDNVLDILITYAKEYNMAAFSPFDGYFMYGPQGIDLYRDHPDVFWSIFQHEYGHQRYSLLPQKAQKELADMFTDDETSQLFYNFVDALISDDFRIYDWDGNENGTAGQSYIKNNNADDPNVLGYALSPTDSEMPGVKDHRMMVFEKDGREIHLMLGGVVSEALSYLSSLVTSDDTYAQESAVGTERRGHEDYRYIHIKRLFDHLKKTGKIDRICDEFGIFPAHMRARKDEVLSTIGDCVTRGLDQYLALREEK
jgi:hypothetical protein